MSSLPVQGIATLQHLLQGQSCSLDECHLIKHCLATGMYVHLNLYGPNLQDQYSGRCTDRMPKLDLVQLPR